MINLNKEIELDENVNLLFDDLMERVEYSTCLMNYNPCLSNSCPLVFGDGLLCVKNC